MVSAIPVNLHVHGFALAEVTPMLSSALYSMLGISSLVSMSSSILTSLPTSDLKSSCVLCFQAIVFK
jgi:hypothetical protein